MTTLLPPADLTDVAGPVLRPGDPGWREEIAGFNLAYTPTPAVVVGATSTADVAAAVRYAASVGKRIAVQATGHGLMSDLDDTVLISTRRMTAVAVDPAARTARVAAGVRWRAVIDAAAEHGLAPLSGSSSQVGVVGYTTGGGLGPLCRRYGFAADHVTRFTIVTADGAVREVARRERRPRRRRPVLGGARRQGQLRDRHRAGVRPRPGDDLPRRRRSSSRARTPPRCCTPGASGRRRCPRTRRRRSRCCACPPTPSCPSRCAAGSSWRCGSPTSAREGPALLAPMRAAAQPIMDVVADLPFAAIDAVHMDPTEPMPTWDRGVALAELPGAAVDAVLAQAGPGVASPLTLVEIRLLGGALARAPRVPNAVTGRDAAFSVFTVGVTAASSVEAVAAAGAAVVEALRPWARGGLLNFLGQAGPGRVGQLWGPADRARLVAIRERFDPAGLLATNVAIG